MQPVEASDYWELARLSQPAVSPTGDRVAYVRTTAERDGDTGQETASVHITPVGGGGSRRFTAADGTDAEPAWSPTGDRLAFVSTRGDAGGGRPQLWVVPVDGGEATRITDVIGGVSNIAWGPDGDRVAFLQAVRPAERAEELDREHDGEYERDTPDPRVIDRQMYRGHTSYRDGARRHVYVADLAAGRVDRVTAGVAECGGPAWGDDGTLYYPIRRGLDADDRLEWAIEAATPADSADSTVVTTVEGMGPTLAVHGSRVAYTTTPADDPTLTQTAVEVFDRDTGATDRLTDGVDRTVAERTAGHAPEWGPDGEHLYVCTPDEGGYVLRRVAADTGDDRVVLAGDRHVHAFSVSADAVAVVQSEWDHPGEVVAATPMGGEEVTLTRANRDYLDERAVSKPESVWIDGPAGDIQGWVLTPPEFDPEETYPLVVNVHGGPHLMWSTAGTMWHEFQTLAARGYVVFWCNPRGSTGYGQEWLRGVERDWGAVTLADVMAGVAAVTDRDYVDADNAFITGGSFGGFMTGWAVGHTDAFAGAVAQRGVYDLTGFYGTTDAYALVEGEFDTDPVRDNAFLWAQSPAAHTDAVDTPTLLVHSEADYRTPANTAELFYRLLKKHGVDTRLVRYPGEGHDLSRSGDPGHVVDRIERIAAWFDGYSDHHEAAPVLETDRPGAAADE
ncbi:S9 family peptidase [Halobacterium salinarum]|uniref:dipeptidyl-peptidase 5 n=1 Tax=Halobacterium salinarum TaxID=2242 RepID=UPI00255439B0|nr:S9 family peptidase [Halobacterium salinarum]MDL0125404.1 S9 family peptidase [Halobacterium salinarum]